VRSGLVRCGDRGRRGRSHGRHILDDAHEEEFRRRAHRGTPTTAAGRGATRDHPTRGRRCSWRSRRGDGGGVCSRCPVQLLGHRRHCRRQRHFEVVAATTQVDELLIVGILEDAFEHALTQALAIASQQLEGLGAHRAGRDSGIAGDQRGRRPLHEVEGLLSREALATATDLIAPFTTRGISTRSLSTRGFGTWSLRTRRVHARFVATVVTFWALGTIRTRVALGALMSRRLGARRGRGLLARREVEFERFTSSGDRKFGGRSGRCTRRALAALLAVATTAAATATSTTSAAFLARGGAVLVGRRRARCCTCRRGAGRPHLELPVLELGDRHQPLLGGIGDELRELRVAVVLLVERGVDVLHHLLEAVGAHDVAVLLHATDGLDHELPRVPLLHVFLARLHEAGEGVVAVVLVAVHDEQVTRRLADADADDVLAVFLELGHQRREVGVAGEEDVGPDLGAGEDQLDGVDREANVGGVLLRRPVGRRHDHVDRGLGQWDDVLRIAAPVGIGALDGDLPLDDVRRQQRAQLAGEVGTDPHRDVVEVDQQRRVRRVLDRGAVGGGRRRRRERLGPPVQRGDGRARDGVPGRACVHVVRTVCGHIKRPWFGCRSVARLVALRANDSGAGGATALVAFRTGRQVPRVTGRARTDSPRRRGDTDVARPRRYLPRGTDPCGSPNPRRWHDRRTQECNASGAKRLATPPSPPRPGRARSPSP
jgi:hypothetical protein